MKQLQITKRSSRRDQPAMNSPSPPAVCPRPSYQTVDSAASVDAAYQLVMAALEYADAA